MSFPAEGNEAAQGHNLLKGKGGSRAGLMAVSLGPRSFQATTSVRLQSCRFGPFRGQFPFLSHTHPLVATPRRPADPERRPIVIDIMQRGVLAVQGPLSLKQGGMGLIGRLPVFIPDSTPDTTFG
jgi:hypothetical protein